MGKSKYSESDVRKMISDHEKGVTYETLGAQWGCNPSHIAALCRGSKGPLKQDSMNRSTKGRAAVNRAKILALVAKGCSFAEAGRRIGLSSSYAAALASKRDLSKKKKENTKDRWNGYRAPTWDQDLSKKWSEKWAEIQLGAA